MTSRTFLVRYAQSELTGRRGRRSLEQPPVLDMTMDLHSAIHFQGYQSHFSPRRIGLICCGAFAAAKCPRSQLPGFFGPGQSFLLRLQTSGDLYLGFSISVPGPNVVCTTMQSVFRQDGTLDATTLDPLPRVLKRGLIAVSFLGFLSFVSSSALLFYLTYKLIKWRWCGQASHGYNQFLLLIYNLLMADVQQSLAFLLTARWLAEGKIDVQTPTCFAEGWFVSTGDLASGMWIFAIALHTFFAIVKGKKLPYLIFLAAIAGLWIFIYAMAVTGVVSHKGNFYVRAGAWVSLNMPQDLRTVLKVRFRSAGSTSDMPLNDCGFTTSGSSSPCSAQ